MDSYKITRPLTIHHYRLLLIFKEGFNPLQSVTSNTSVIILLFIKKSVMRNIIEGLRKVQYI